MLLHLRAATVFISHALYYNILCFLSSIIFFVFTVFLLWCILSVYLCCAHGGAAFRLSLSKNLGFFFSLLFVNAVDICIFNFVFLCCFTFLHRFKFISVHEKGLIASTNHTFTAAVRNATSFCPRLKHLVGFTNILWVSSQRPDARNFIRWHSPWSHIFACRRHLNVQ